MEKHGQQIQSASKEEEEQSDGGGGDDEEEEEEEEEIREYRSYNSKKDFKGGGGGGGGDRGWSSAKNDDIGGVPGQEKSLNVREGTGQLERDYRDDKVVLHDSKTGKHFVGANFRREE